ncbi:MAG TPA: shikimate dehydrogenase, partial [Candidatus Limnocylindria bacterium]|nr:shikimate dehydrogenase [Candidatus Limnocylindria bacterium]
GAGGAARAAAYYCKKRGSKILYLNRTLSKAEQLRKEFGGTIVNLPRLKADDIDVIINATSVGMYPQVQIIPLPIKFLRKGQHVFDVVYNEGQTEFLKQAKNKGAKIISGMDMFIGQAIKQIEIYSGRSLQNLEIFRYAKKIVTRNI